MKSCPKPKKRLTSETFENKDFDTLNEYTNCLYIRWKNACEHNDELKKRVMTEDKKQIISNKRLVLFGIFVIILNSITFYNYLKNIFQILAILIFIIILIILFFYYKKQLNIMEMLEEIMRK